MRDKVDQGLRDTLRRRLRDDIWGSPGGGHGMPGRRGWDRLACVLLEQELATPEGQARLIDFLRAELADLNAFHTNFKFTQTELEELYEILKVAKPAAPIGAMRDGLEQDRDNVKFMLSVPDNKYLSQRHLSVKEARPMRERLLWLAERHKEWKVHRMFARGADIIHAAIERAIKEDIDYMYGLEVDKLKGAKRKMLSRKDKQRLEQELKQLDPSVEC